MEETDEGKPEEKIDEEVKENVEEKPEKTEAKIDNNPDKFDASKIVNKAKQNPWMIVSGVLLIVVVILLFRGGGITGGVIGVSDNEVGANLLNFAEAQDMELELIDVIDKGSFYEVGILVNGEESGVFITKDGEYIIQPVVSLTAEVTAPTQNPEEPDWTIFKNSLDVETSEIILNFNIEESKQTDNERVMEFESYQECKNKLIVFYSAGCGWCTRYHPVLEQAQNDYPELEIYALSLGENRDIAEKYGATGTPANIINCKYFASGYMDKEVLYGILDNLN